MKNPYSTELGYLIQYLKRPVAVDDYLSELPYWPGLTARQKRVWEDEQDFAVLVGMLTPKQVEKFMAWAPENVAVDAYIPTKRDVEFLRVVRRNEWLAHFTDNPERVCEKGFIYGQPDMTILALTTHFTEQARKREPGWNFAFLAEDDRTIKRASQFYGRHAVLFQSAGALVFHSGDDYRQVIFWGPHVKKVFPIFWEDDEWELVLDRKRAVRTETISAMVDWLDAHQQQYRKVGCVV